MWAKLQPDGTVAVPVRAVADGVVGDGWQTVAPGDPGYDRAYAEATSENNPFAPFPPPPKPAARSTR